MCGIAGIHSFSATSSASAARRLAAMTGVLCHRGPDEEGMHVDDAVALASRRLRVIDLATGHMPITNERGTVHVVYNGEIYNYWALRTELAARGHHFRTTSDTEVLVHLYEDEGIGGVSRLNGMFAFALWDSERQELFLVRDRLGIKPLYYQIDPAQLSFASELKGLLAAADVTPVIDPSSLAEYVALGYVRAPRTIFAGYAKLPPGYILRSHRGTVTQRPYWRFPTTITPPCRTEADAMDALDAVLHAAVRDRLVADVPLGAFLSGGVDSSLVVALAARQTAKPLDTFSVGFRGDDELRYARLVAERYGTRHHELMLDPEDCHIVDRLIDSFDEPFGDDSAVPTYFVSELARQHVTVALSGDGGDELFGGYDRYAFDARWAWIDRIPERVRRIAFGGPGRMLPSGALGKNLLRGLAASRQDRYAMHVARELDPRLGGLLSVECFRNVTVPSNVFGDEFSAAAALPFPAQLLYVDALTYLPDDILTKVDRMSMAHSLEARVPLLDHRVVEFAAHLPIEWKIHNGQRKRILKRVAERYVPMAVLDRPKRGFSLPIKRWMRREIAGVLSELLFPDAPVSRYLEARALRRVVREHRSGRRDHAETLWRIVVLERWLRRFHDGRVGRTSPGRPSCHPGIAPVGSRESHAGA